MNSLLILADCHIQLTQFVWLRQNITLYSKENFVREDDSRLVHKVEKFNKLHEEEALDSCLLSILWGNEEL